MGPLARQGTRCKPATPNSARLSSLPSISHPLARICNPIPDSAMIPGRCYRGCTRRNVLPAYAGIRSEFDPCRAPRRRRQPHSAAAPRRPPPPQMPLGPQTLHGCPAHPETGNSSVNTHARIEDLPHSRRRSPRALPANASFTTRRAAPSRRFSVGTVPPCLGGSAPPRTPRRPALEGGGANAPFTTCRAAPSRRFSVGAAPGRPSRRG